MAASKQDEARTIAAAALELAASKGWRNVSLHDIAGKAGVSLSELYKRHLSREAILDSFVRAIDEEILAGMEKEDADASPRDRLFEILMRRFDALSPYKKGIAAVLRDAVCDPVAMGFGLRRYLLSMAWMLEGAGVSTSGLHGALRVKGLAVVYFAVLQVWFADETEDQGQTMAALDTWLKRAEWAETQFPWPGEEPSKKPKKETPGSPPAS